MEYVPVKCLAKLESQSVCGGADRGRRRPASRQGGVKQWRCQSVRIRPVARCDKTCGNPFDRADSFAGRAGAAAGRASSAGNGAALWLRRTSLWPTGAVGPTVIEAETPLCTGKTASLPGGHGTRVCVQENSLALELGCVTRGRAGPAALQAVYSPTTGVCNGDVYVAVEGRGRARDHEDVRGASQPDRDW